MAQDLTSGRRWQQIESELRSCREAQRSTWGETDNVTLGRFVVGELGSEEAADLNEEVEKRTELSRLVTLVAHVLQASNVMDQ